MWNKSGLTKIHYHLDEFEFAQAKKLVALKGGVRLLALRDDMIPFVKLHSLMTVIPLRNYAHHTPIVYWINKTFHYGFITCNEDKSIKVASIKSYPLEFSVSKKHVLGKISLCRPRWLFIFQLKRVIESEEYKLVR